MTRINIALLQPLDFLKFQDPIDPQYFALSCWRWLYHYDGTPTFPLIKPVSFSALAEGGVADLGQDYNGSEIGIMTTGPEKGCTVQITAPRDTEGRFALPKVN